MGTKNYLDSHHKVYSRCVHAGVSELQCAICCLFILPYLVSQFVSQLQPVLGDSLNGTVWTLPLTVS